MSDTQRADDSEFLDGSLEHEVEGPRGRWYSARHLVVSGLACLLLGFGVGTSITTRKYSQREQARYRFTEIDRGFVDDMLDHHDQAVEMSLITLERPGISSVVKHFATEVIVFQRYEVGQLESRLDAWGLERGEDDRVAMAWMGMGTKVADMPGMATAADLDRLQKAEGVNANREFLTLMRAHHNGGIHMAEYARQQATDSDVQLLATRMATNQKQEVAEYTQALAGLPAA